MAQSYTTSKVPVVPVKQADCETEHVPLALAKPSISELVFFTRCNTQIDKS
jgi:hypothetical protein